MLRSLRPKESLSEQETNSALWLLVVDGVCANIMSVLTTGAFLVSFALLLGASHKVIGLLAAIQPIAQVLQIPTVYLVERTRYRKAVTMLTAGASRLTYVAVALLPWLVAPQHRLVILLVALLFHFSLSAMAGCGFNSWIRDVIPENRMATFFARRMAWSAAVSASLSLASGCAIDLYSRYHPVASGYTFLFGFAIVAGMSGLYYLGRVAEPQMPAVKYDGLMKLLAQPFKNLNYRKLLLFIGVWNFTVNFVSPFFTVYLISRLKLSMTYVVGLTVLSQMTNVLFFGLWARLSDSHSNKSVIAVAAPMFFFTFLLWPFTNMPDAKFLMAPILIVIYILHGMATSGVNLCVTNLALRAAPFGKASSFVAVNALVMGIAAAIAPILAGICADYFEARELTLTVTWFEDLDVTPVLTLRAMDLRGLDFIFGIGFLLGVLAYYRILAIDEPGEVGEAVVRAQLLSEIRRVARQVSSMASVPLTFMPFSGRRIQNGIPKDPEAPAE
ncbi:MAG: MFS transporter [Candidatus Hydrogenedentes bacterium]|nr:MFS transporter [Candidatus Hydrogenedentota bacterium]